MYVGLSKTLIELRSSRFLHLGSYPTATFLGFAPPHHSHLKIVTEPMLARALILMESIIGW